MDIDEKTAFIADTMNTNLIIFTSIPFKGIQGDNVKLSRV